MPPMFLPTPEDHEASLQTLADEVRTELEAAGLPVLPDDCGTYGDQASGVSIEPDEVVKPDHTRVWVSWKVKSPLAEASTRAFMVGAWRPDSTDEPDVHPAMRHWGIVQDTMADAIETILRSLGYGVQVDANDYRPGALLVSARAPGPHWRDPAVPPLAGSAGYSPGVRVRLVAGEFVASVTTVVSATYQLSAPAGPPIQYAVEHPNGDGLLNVAPEDLTLAEI